MIVIRNAHPTEYAQIGLMMTEVYSQLDGFPTPEDQPGYYHMLLNVGDLCVKPETELLVAVENGQVVGAVVYFGDMRYYGSGGTATAETNASGFRLLAVVQDARGKGVGTLLTRECIRKATLRNQNTVVIHTTKAMQTAWRMYERIGFKRSEDLDFMQGDLPVFGFRYSLAEAHL